MSFYVTSSHLFMYIQKSIIRLKKFLGSSIIRAIPHNLIPIDPWYNHLSGLCFTLSTSCHHHNYQLDFPDLILYSSD